MDAGQVFAEGAYHDVRFGLYNPTLHYTGTDWGRDVLQPWVASHPSLMAALHRAGSPEMASVGFQAESSWALYAFSRMLDVLILPLQPPSTELDDADDWLPDDAYGQFLSELDAGFPAGPQFHPFLHEIVAVEPAEDPQAPPEVIQQWWPGCMIGSLLMMRSGVTVRAGAHHLDPVVATTSLLYWASRRRYRTAVDLSHGWGSNSLWRTGFRRDYRLTDRLLYNVDAALDPRQEHPGLVPFNRDVDLLRYRCATLADHAEEQWVWENHHAEPVAGGW